MELPNEGIFCVAKASHPSIAQATAKFPYPINLSKQKAEIAVKYIAVTPSWRAKNNLELTVSSDKNDDERVVVFESALTGGEDKVILALRTQIAAEFQGTEPGIKIVNAPGNKSQIMKLKQGKKLSLSQQLSTLLGMKSEYTNNGPDKYLSIPILFQDDEVTSSTDIYYLKCDHISGNFFLDGKQDRIIELLHISGNSTVDFYPKLTYTVIEDCLLERVVFTLYNEANEPVSSFNTDLYIVCHIRPQI